MTIGKVLRGIAQVGLGGVLGYAGISHLTVARQEFQAQVPSWVPVDPDLVVLASGVVEIGFGAALLTMWKQPLRALVGGAAAAFFVAVFPGNIGQWMEGKDGFGLDTDAKRFGRLFFQPVLVLWALLATDAVGTWRRHRRRGLGR